MEGTSKNKQEQKATKQPATQKIHVNKIHSKLGHSREDKLRETARHLNYSVKGALEVYEDYAIKKPCIN